MRRASLALIGAALLIVSDLCPESAAAENSASLDPSLVAAVRAFGRELWASALLDEDPATLRILLQVRDSDLQKSSMGCHRENLRSQDSGLGVQFTLESCKRGGGWVVFPYFEILK